MNKFINLLRKRTGLFNPLLRNICYSAILLFSYSLAVQAQDWGSGAVTLTNGQNITQNVVLTRDVVITVATDHVATISGNISGNYGITLMGSGEGTNPAKLILLGNNTYTGQTGVAGAVLQVGNGVSTTASISSTSDVGMYFGMIRFEPAADMTFSKVISGVGNVELKGNIPSRYVYFTADNTYTGTTTVEAGNLLLGNNTTAGMVAGDIILNGNTMLYFRRSNETIYSGVISGAGTVLKYGTNKLTLNNANTYTGDTYLNDGGTLVLGASGSIENSSSVVFWGSASKFDISAGNKKIKALYGSSADDEVILGSSTLTIGTSGQADGGGDFEGKITGTGSIVKAGSAKLTLAGANTYTGSTTINGGILQTGNGTSTTATINSTSGVSVGSGATLRFEPGATMTFSKVISGTGNVELKGNAIDCNMYFTANNSYTGTTTVEAGRLLLGNGSTTGMVAGDIILNNVNAQLYFQRSDDITYSGVISGTGHVYKYGTNKLTLNNANTYTGNTAISNGAGTLALGANGSIENSSPLIFWDAAKFDISAGGNKKIKALNCTNANAEIVLGSNTLTIGTSGSTDGGGDFAGKITGTGAIVKTGSAKLTLTGANTYTGTTAINGGTLELGGTNGAITGNISIASGATLSIAHTGSFSYGGIISGAGGVTKIGTGTFVMYAAHTATGVFQHNNGAVSFGNNSKWAGAYNKAAGTTLYVNGNVSIGGALTLAGGDIRMRTSIPAAKLTVGGAVSASGTNTLDIIEMGTANSYDLIEAASGIPNTTPYALTGATGYSLAANGTKLTLVKDAAGTVQTGNYTGSVTIVENVVLNISETVNDITIGLGNSATAGQYALSVQSIALVGAEGLPPFVMDGVTIAGGALSASPVSVVIPSITIPAVPPYIQTPMTLTNVPVEVGLQSGTIAGNVLNLNLRAKVTLLSGLLVLNFDLAFSGTLSAAPTKSVSVGAQTGTITAGTAGTVTFPVTTANIANGSYTATVDNLPAGVFVQGQVAINNNSGTLTLSGDASTVAGTTNTLRLTINETQSGQFTLTISPAATKSVSAGAQSGTLTAGTAGTVTFPVTTANIANGSYTATVATLPTGVTVQGNVTINNNSGTLTLSGNASTVAGATNTLRLTIDGTQSPAFTLTISPAGTKSVSVGAQNGTITAGTAGQVTFPVTTANIANGSYTATVTDLPAGVSVQGQVTINNNSGTLTLSGNASTTAGATGTLRLIIDGVQSGQFTLTIENLTGTEEIFAPTLKAYPNPFTDVLRITGAEGCTLRVMNAAGTAVFTRQIISPDETHQLEYLPAGMYFFRFEQGENAKTVKVIKN